MGRCSVIADLFQDPLEMEHSLEQKLDRWDYAPLGLYDRLGVLDNRSIRILNSGHENL